jgi:predicted nucleotidyltransferase
MERRERANSLPYADRVCAATVCSSMARGTQGPESDYDILVLTETPLTAAEEDRFRQATTFVAVLSQHTEARLAQEEAPQQPG